MSIVVELPAELESRIRAMAEEEDTTPAALLARLAADYFGPEDLTAVAEIGEALADAEAAQARGELLTVEEAFAELDARAARRKREQSAAAA